jgi:hypothetical protein
VRDAAISKSITKATALRRTAFAKTSLTIGGPIEQADEGAG